MIGYSKQNKKGWEFNAYDFWIKHSGNPSDRAKNDLADPIKMLKRYARYFDNYKGIKIANICGSCGKKAIPLAILGSDVTVFQIFHKMNYEFLGNGCNHIHWHLYPKMKGDMPYHKLSLSTAG